MTLKTVFVLCACIALALGAAIEPREKRQTDQTQNASSMMSGLSNLGSSMGSGSQTGSDILSGMQNGMSSTGGFGEMASSAMSSISNGIQGIGGRLQNAFNNTYQEERNSVSDSFNSVKDRFHQNIETAGNLTKTAFDLGTIFPKFGKNLIIDSDSN